MVARLFCKAIEKMEKTEKVKRAEEPVETKAKVVGKIGWEFWLRTASMTQSIEEGRYTLYTGWCANEAVLLDAAVPIPCLQ